MFPRCEFDHLCRILLPVGDSLVASDDGPSPSVSAASLGVASLRVLESVCQETDLKGGGRITRARARMCVCFYVCVCSRQGYKGTAEAGKCSYVLS